MSDNLPYHRSWFDNDEINEVVDTLKSGWLTTGPKTHQFEEAFKEYIGCRHAVALNSCTAGLHLALAAQDLPRGTEVITTPMTFPATVNVIVHQGLKPVFVDIEPGTLNMNASLIEERITPDTRAIVPVHFAGHACDMDVLDVVAKKHNLAVIEDAAHALETRYKDRKIGNSGHPTSFSFYATKNITTGEGGMLTTNDEALAEKIRVMRLHGLSRDAWKRYDKDGFAHWELHTPGFKYNMADINAALGLHQIKKVDRFYEIRKGYAERYDAAFASLDEIQSLTVRDYCHSAYHIYVIALRLDKLTLSRDEFLNALQSSGIGVAVHFNSMHKQPFIQKHFPVPPESLPVVSDYDQRILSLPLYPKMQPADVDRVIDAVRDLVTRHRRP